MAVTPARQAAGYSAYEVASTVCILFDPINIVKAIKIHNTPIIRQSLLPANESSLVVIIRFFTFAVCNHINIQKYCNTIDEKTSTSSL
jgi:hypothetical protein